LSIYAIGVLRHALSIVALSRYTIVTALFPVTWVMANLLFSIVLIVRRRQVADVSKI
jgi:hypothetical protein